MMRVVKLDTHGHLENMRRNPKHNAVQTAAKSHRGPVSRGSEAH